MKKVGIITIYGIKNYGNRLQNYALQEVIKKLGFECYTLKNYNYLNKKKFFLLRWLKHTIEKTNQITQRDKGFIDFNKNIKFYDKIITSYSNLYQFDYIVVGSDQVWNPYMSTLNDVTMVNLKTKAKKISYAASFGVSKIDNKYKKFLNKNIRKFSSISVREDEGKQIIEEATDLKNIEVVLDPTMLLQSYEWEKIMKEPKTTIKEKYILNYFLGNLTPDRKKEIERIAKKYNCKIINLYDSNDPFYNSSPSEFLWLEKNAFLICTDSFHSCVFALIFNRPFIVFDRIQKNVENMNSRINTLISKLELKNRKYNNKNITNENLNHNYNKAYELLEIERTKSIDFLKNGLTK